MTFVHACGNLSLLLSGYALDRRGDLRGIIEMGEFVLPWPIRLYVPLDVLYQIAEAFPCVVACAFVMDIAEDPLNRIGPWTVRREPEQLKTGVACQPLLDGLGFMHTVGIHDARDARDCWRWGGAVQQRQEVTKQPVIFSRPKAIQHLASSEMQRPSEIVFLILPWRHDLFLRALQHPSHADFRQEVDIEFIRKDHHLMRPQVFVLKPNPSQPLDPVWVWSAKNVVCTPLDNLVPHGDNKYGEQPRSQRGAFAMLLRPRLLHNLIQLVCMLLLLLGDGVRSVCLCLRPSTRLAAENLFLRKQLALYQERHVKPRRATNATRLTLTWLGRWFDWRQALAVVQPETFLRWHRQGFRLFWRWTSTPGRPPLPAALQALIRRMAQDTLTWGEERIANELLLKLGLRVSPRTVRKYMPKRLNHGPGKRGASQRWRTCVRNHAQAIVACDFCVVVTATFRLLYVFVLMEHATRRILHVNETTHPTASWTLQQLREAIPADHGYRFLLHDRDRSFSPQLDQSIHNLGLRVLKTPPQSPQANALCERLVGTLRRECLDFVIPFTAHHVRRILHEWVRYDNTGRPHMALGPGIPQPSSHLPVALHAHRHRLPDTARVMTRRILGGLHHEYRLAAQAA
jgi:putative transposase